MEFGSKKSGFRVQCLHGLQNASRAALGFAPRYNYGFYYARDTGIYKNAQLEVTISHASGAPVVAAQVGSGNIYAGTTTSDNVLRLLARGGHFSRIFPILTYNPSVVAVLEDSSIRGLADLQGKIVGVNKQASVYQQFLWLKRHGKLGLRRFSEYPIGYGGAEQLKTGTVNAILAYTTNVVVDLKRQNIAVREIRFDGDNCGNLEPRAREPGARSGARSN